MIILLEHGADEAALHDITRRLGELGLQARLLHGAKGRAYEVSGPEPGRALALRGAAGVRDVLSRRTALEAGEPLWPHVALRVALLSLALLLLLLALVVAWPPGLGDAAHPDSPPQGDGVEWYLRPAARLFALAGGHGALAGGLLAVLWLVVLSWPFLERADVDTPRGRTLARLVQVAGALALLAWAVLAAGGGS